MSAFNRRQFGAIAGTASVAAFSSAETSSRIDPIDAHVHVWTPDVNRYPLSKLFDRSSMKPPSFTPEQLFAQCRPHGVKRIVLIQMSFYQFDNRYMLDVMKQYPGTFGGVAIVDDTKDDVAARMRHLASRGVRGFRLYANEKNTSTWKSTAGVQTMWRTAAEENLAMCLLSDPESLPQIDRMCQQFPDTPVVIDHFSRIGMRGPIDQKQLDALRSLSRFENVSVKVSAFYAMGKKQPPYLDLAPMIRKLRDAFGAERLMWASDCPFQLEDPHSYAASIELVRDRLDFLSEEEKRHILQTTAEKRFFNG